MRCIFALLLFSSFLNAQEFYLINGNNDIYLYDYDTGITQFIVTVNYPGSQALTDIAYADADHFYGTDSGGAIINIDLITGDYTPVFELIGDYGISGLAYSNNQLSLINSIAWELITIDLNTNTVVSELPIGTGNSGDITFYEGNLLFQGTTSADVLAYNGIEIKSVACAESVGLWGMANYFTGCGSNLVLAFNEGGKVWEYNVDGQTNTQIDDLYSTVGGIYGATTVNEQFALNCNLVNLEEVYCKFLRDDYVFVCEYNDITDTNSIQYLDTGYNLYHLFDIDLSGAILRDIAFSSEGLFYGITNDQEIIQIFADSTYESVNSLNGVDGYFGLVGNAENQLILIGNTENKMLTFDIASNSIVSEAEIPEGSPGDATFYRGNIVFQGLSNDFYAFFGTNSKTILCNEIAAFRAVSNRFTNCQVNDVVVFTENGSLYKYELIGNTRLIFERNLSSQVDVIYGAANRLEFMASDCTFENLNEVNCNLSIDESRLNRINLYPNPANDSVFVSTSDLGENLFYSIFNLNGKELEMGVIESQINTSKFQSGIYFIVLYNPSKTVSTAKKLIIKH